ncbi:MAG: HepT-like ribonuclease domain-containing protein [Nitrospinota bacterium]
MHFYFGIDYEIVWNIARKELPKLQKQIREIVKLENE